MSGEELAPFLWVDAEEPPGDPPPAPTDAPPGEAGLWVFVLGDMTIFAVFFVVLVVQRLLDHPAVVDQAHRLVLPLGLTNTLVLLTSSWVVVLATGAHRVGDRRRCRLLLGAALVLAATFVVVKVVEYSVELGGGHLDVAAPFVAIYLVLTGLHLVHVVVGTTLLARWRVRAGRPWPVVRRFAEGCAVYWHMVDLLWVLIFTLVYVVARH